ncbi:hypothetical protein [Sphingomonas sp.]|uniref:hypothetical protein n=1 Tax=Sphingomonas sp. TaxID=28214 RepID=UPI002EDBB38C
MPMIAPLTELEAVNSILLSIGQAPVNTLSVSGLTDASVARTKLTEVTRRVLTRGFAFNQDDDWPLAPDADGVVLIPAGVLKVRPNDQALAVQRSHPVKGRALWNRQERSWSFSEAVPCRITWGFPFEELPETARCYIATVAGRQFQARVVGSQILDRFLEEDVASAWVLLEREERAARGTNLFRNNATLAGFGSRSF